MKVDLWMTHTAECPKCSAEMLVCGAPREGDHIQCPSCREKLTVGDICGEHRSDETPEDLMVSAI